MEPLTEAQIRDSFVNASRREVTTANLPEDFATLRWDRLEYLGWTDRKYPTRAYVVVPLADGPVGVMLRPSEGMAKRRSAMCAWCEDVVATADVALQVAKRAGAPGRNGNTIGTLLHTDFSCSGHVRRPPTMVESGGDPEAVIARRIAGLRERAARFVEHVLDGETPS